MKFTQRETFLGMLTVATLMFGITAIISKGRIEQWKTLRSLQAETIAEIEANKKLIAEKQEWQKRYDAISQKLVALPADKKTDSYWLSVMDKTASAHSLNISKRQTLEEKDIGGVYELPIDCQWEGTLSSLVHFLFELQSQGAMFDVRQLLIRPASKDMLRGRFILYCAYTREKGAATTP